MASTSPDSLHQLAYQGDFEAVKVKVIMNNKALTETDESGRILLHWAASGGRTELVRWLLEHNSPVDPLDESKWTPLIIACSAGHEDVVRLLIGADAQINACTDQGRSGLLYACSRNRDKIVKLLLDEHADINLQDKLGASPLHRAASCGHLKLHFLMTMLNIIATSLPGMLRGSVTYLRELKDLLFLTFSARWSKMAYDYFSLLISHISSVLHVMFDYSNQLDLNAQDQCKNTPLHLACEDGQVEVIKMLVEAGANKFIENKEEKKPLDLAKPEVVRIVREWFE